MVIEEKTIQPDKGRGTWIKRVLIVSRVPVPAGTRLGPLCKRGHDYRGVGMSLRRIFGGCIECKKITSRDWIPPIPTEQSKAKRKIYEKIYRSENKEILRKNGKTHYVNNIEFYKERNNKNIAELTDTYIKRVLGKHPLGEEWPTKTIELKRKQLEIFREIKKQLKGQ